MRLSAPLIAELRTLSGKPIDLGLARMQRLLARIGDPQKRLPPVVHIAGTNGKGSLVAHLRAILEADGQRVHTYTSPPLRHLSDQITLAAAPGRSVDADDQRLAGALTRVLAAHADEGLTSFEGETAAALLLFSETPADFVILETGMGGRLDATNVVDQPALTVIMPISLDHTEFLGKTVGAIAAEKAGILKRGTPAIIARQEQDALDEIRVAAEKLGLPLTEFGQDFDAYEQHGRLVVQDQDALYDLPLPKLTGRHQAENAGVAVIAASRLTNGRITEETLARGLARVTWPARLDRLSSRGLAARLPDNSEIWLDGGHNAAAAASLARAMADLEERAPKPLHLIVGMLASKDPTAFLKPFKDLAKSIVAVPIPDTSRAYVPGLDTFEIVARARALELDAYEARSIGAALSGIGRTDKQPLRVLITGSFHLAGSVLELEERALAAKVQGGGGQTPRV